MANTIVVELDLDDLNAQKELKKFEGEAKKSGDKSGSNFSDGFAVGLKSLAKNAAIAAAAVAAIGGGLAIRAGVRAAQQQEDAIKRLNTALSIAGDFSEEASQDFQRFASELQNVSRFGDEVILNQIALAKSFGATNDQAKQAAQAGADLAEAFGIDIESATRNAAKTLGGYAGELGEVIPELKELTTEQLRAGEGIRLLNERFGGTARQQVQTFSGAISQASNAFGDLLEEVGFFITQSPVLTKLIGFIGKGFKTVSDAISDFRGNGDIFGNAIRSAANFSQAIIDFVIRPLEIVFNVAARLAKSIEEPFLNVVNSIGNFFNQLFEKIKPVLDFVGQEVGFFFDGIKAKAEELNTEEGGLLAGVLDEKSFTDTLNSGLQSLIAFVDTAEPKVKTGLKNIREEGKKTAETLKVSADQINQAWRNSLVKGVSGGIQTVITSIAKGENAIENFGNFILGVFGDLAIQLGEFFIATGLAKAKLFALDPTGTIVAGVALVALGSILKSFSGGAGSSTGGGSGGGATTGGTAELAESTEALDDPDNFRERQVASNVNIRVEGSLVRQEELGLFIQDTLNEVNQKNGIVQVNTRSV